MESPYGVSVFYARCSTICSNSFNVARVAHIVSAVPNPAGTNGLYAGGTKAYKSFGASKLALGCNDEVALLSH
jgi:hypothetical protein